jgi:hypothetical protein
MMGAMRRRLAGFLSKLILLAIPCPAQTPAPAIPSGFLEIDLPPGVISESFFVRYTLTGVNYSSWVAPRTGVTSYIVHTTHEGRPATGIKAVLHAPGCAIRTLDLPLTGAENPRYSFICQPIRTIEIQGTLDRPDILHGHDVELQARYIARWAPRFLGIDGAIATSFPVGDAAFPSPDGHLRLVVPDLSHDALAGAPDHPGELQVWAKDRDTGAPIAQLLPSGLYILKTRMGGLAVRSAYPSGIVFAPRAADCAYPHDSEGFAIRPDPWDACIH